MSEPMPGFVDPFDDCERLPAREAFRRLEFEPPPPSALDARQLRGRLWEFIYAMAGLRCYLYHSDHLSDRELYSWLHDEWLEEDIADIPPEAEWNCLMDMTDFNNGTDPIIWLKYFATEAERLDFAEEHSLKCLPAHVDPPCDRDRWLPEPTIVPGDIPEDADDEDPFPPDEEAAVEDDPLGLEAVDAEIRAVRSCEEPAVLAGGETPEGRSHASQQLRRGAIVLPPPEELTEETLTGGLWELLHHLACRGCYVLHTDHLSDRELYARLWRGSLPDQALVPSKCPAEFRCHDLVGGVREEDVQLRLRFYADDAERAEYAASRPGVALPPREKPPFRRDWRLPLGPF